MIILFSSKLSQAQPLNVSHPTRGGGFKSNLIINKGSKGEGLTPTAGVVVLKQCYLGVGSQRYVQINLVL